MILSLVLLGIIAVCSLLDWLIPFLAKLEVWHMLHIDDFAVRLLIFVRLTRIVAGITFIGYLYYVSNQ